eukprot:377888_1
MSVYASHKDYRSHVLALNACTNTRNKSLAKSISVANINNSHVANALIHFYGSFGDIESGWSVFNAIEEKKKDIVSINTMMTVLIHNDLNEDALEVMALKACANSGNIATG